MAVSVVASREATAHDVDAAQIAFSSVTLILGGKPIVEDLSLAVRPGEFLCVVGASGCGKTTALRLAAGLYQPTSGSVQFDVAVPEIADETFFLSILSLSLSLSLSVFDCVV